MTQNSGTTYGHQKYKVYIGKGEQLGEKIEQYVEKQDCQNKLLKSEKKGGRNKQWRRRRRRRENIG